MNNMINNRSFKPYEYTINDSQYFVELEAIDLRTVNTGRFRTDKYLPASSRENSVVATRLSEFFDNLCFQIGFLKYVIEDYGQEISGSILRSALITACENHIAKHKRLINNDLYAYIDVNFYIASSITSKPDIEIQSMYDGVAREMTGIFKDFIFISDPLLGLRKLT